MIVLSAGMQKAGTGWYWSLTNDLLVAAGYQNGREIRDRYGLHPILTTLNCNVPRLDSRHLMRLDELGSQGHTFAVKTHKKPTPLLRKLVAQGGFKATYIYRDLRDVIVAALDRGKVMRTTGELRGRHFYGLGPYRSFAKYHTVAGATWWARFRLMPVWKAYASWDCVLATRYEDLVADTVGQLRRLAEFLDLDLSDDQMRQIVARYQPDRMAKEKPIGMHFNKGVVGRFKEKLSVEEQQLCERRLGGCLRMMGYLD